MPYPRPTLTQLIDQTQANISAGLESPTALLRFSNLRILGKALAKGVSGLYGYLDYIAKQAVPWSATGEYAIGWGALKDVTIKPATFALGPVVFSGSAGSIIPAGTPIARASDNATFVTTADAAIAGGQAIVPVIAGTAGMDGNCQPGVTFTIAKGIAGVSSAATTILGIDGGADVESVDDFKARYLAAYAAPPQGGAEQDYVKWATDIAGVTRAWVRRNGQGAGTVVVYFMMDVVEAAAGGFPQGTAGVAALEGRDLPATGDQLVVANAIYPLQPVGALVYATAPGANVLDFTIAGIPTASPATQAAINAAIAAALAANASPGGVTINGGAGGITQLSAIERAVSAIPSAAGFVITAIHASNGSVTPGAAGNMVSNIGYLAKLGVVTFV